MQNKILIERLSGIREGILLSDHTTYKIGGPAKYFFIAEAEEHLVAALKIAKELKVPAFILGGGSNLLVSDKGFNGLVIKIQNTEFRIQNSEEIYVEAGVDLTKLAYATAKAGLSGLEWGAGIPGTIGGAVFGNAQAFGTKISDAVQSVRALNIKTLQFKNFSKKQCHFSLKNSIFKKDKNWVIVSVVLRLKKDKLDQINARIKEFLDYRKTHHPLNFPSAGSTFVNPEITVKNKKLFKKFPELLEYNKKGIIPAGFMIEKCGLSGRKIGQAQISEKHANFIINLGGAKAKDVLSLISLAKKQVKDNFGISLKPEVQFVGF